MHVGNARLGRGKLLAAAAVGVMLSAVVAVAALGIAHHRHHSAPRTPVLATTTVVRTDLTTTATYNASVGFGAEQTVSATGSGTITRLPAAGSVIGRGRPLYWVDDRPVVVFYGATPLFRPLGPSVPSSAARVRLHSDQAELLAAQQALATAENHNETSISARQDQLSISAAEAAVTAARQRLDSDQRHLRAATAACAAGAGTTAAASASARSISADTAGATGGSAGTGNSCAERPADMAAVSADRGDRRTAQQTLSQARLSVAAKQYVSPASLARDSAAVARARQTVTADRAELSQAASPPTGQDVAVVAANLVACGDLPASQAHVSTWSAALTQAVQAFQRAVGLAVTGTLAPSQVVVTPGPARVAEISAHVGDQAGSQVLSLTGTAKLITFTGSGNLHAGQAVTVSPSSGTSESGRIITVAPSGNQLQVEASASDPDALPAGSARVTVTTASHPGVLAVPVEALLALANGGYALQTPANRLLPVRTGLIANDQVEVSGPGVHAGLRVVTAA
jgi:hypothetical protein